MAKKYIIKEESFDAPEEKEAKYSKKPTQFEVTIHDSCIAMDAKKKTYTISSVYGYDEDGFDHVYSSGIFTEGYKMTAELEEDGTVQISETIKNEGDTTAD